MKIKTLHFIIPLLFLIFFASCEEETTNPDNNNPKGCVRGIVTDNNGNLLSGIEIESNGKSVRTLSRGEYILCNIPVTDYTSVSARSMNYCENSEITDIIENDTVTVNLMLRPIGSEHRIGTSKTTINEEDVSLTIPEDAFVFSNGAPAEGEIRILMTKLGSDNNVLKDYFPGKFLGLDNNGNEVDISTIECIEIKAYHGYNELDLADGKKVTVSMKIPEEQFSDAPATIPLWYYNFEKGLWIQEGQATKEGYRYVGEISHFSYWCSAYKWDRAWIEGQIYDYNGSVARDCYVWAEGVNYIGVSYEYTDNNGYYKIPVKSYSTVRVRAFNGIRSSEFTEVETPLKGQTVKVEDLKLKKGDKAKLTGTISGALNFDFQTTELSYEEVNERSSIWAYIEQGGKVYSMLIVFIEELENRTYSIPDEAGIIFYEGNIIEADVTEGYEAYSGSITNSDIEISFEMNGRGSMDSTKTITITNGLIVPQ